MQKINILGNSFTCFHVVTMQILSPGLRSVTRAQKAPRLPPFICLLGNLAHETWKKYPGFEEPFHMCQRAVTVSLMAVS